MQDEKRGRGCLGPGPRPLPAPALSFPCDPNRTAKPSCAAAVSAGLSKDPQTQGAETTAPSRGTGSPKRHARPSVSAGACYVGGGWRVGGWVIPTRKGLCVPVPPDKGGRHWGLQPLPTVHLPERSLST